MYIYIHIYLFIIYIYYTHTHTRFLLNLVCLQLRTFLRSYETTYVSEVSVLIIGMPFLFISTWIVCKVVHLFVDVCVQRKASNYICSYGRGFMWVWGGLAMILPTFIRFITTLKHVPLYFYRRILQTINNQWLLLSSANCH